MRLILAEKPSVAWDIAQALGTPQKHDGYLTVGSDTLTWAYGHLLTLAEPDQYDPAWKAWDWATLPMLPEHFQLTPQPQTVAHLKTVTRLMTQATRIVCATDADREGELIFRYIYAQAHIKKPVDRLWLSENTPQAIHRALAAMRPASAYNALAQAAQARAQADWLVGLNATRAFSLQHGQPGHPLSVGRVQTPTLQVIVDRDAAIAAFQPTAYWRLLGQFQTAVGDYSGVWQGADPEHPAWIRTEAEVQALAARLPPGTPGRIERLESKTVTIAPPLLFNLNDLQKEANRRLGLTAQQTLEAAQHLYDAHLTSYPRTEARAITTDVAQTIPGRLQALTVGSPALRAQVHQELPRRLPRLVHNQAVAQAGHYAIIPTGQRAPTSLSARDQAVYDLIARRFLAALLPPGQDERTTVWTRAGGERFKTVGTQVRNPGWRAALAPDPPDKEAEKAAADDADSDRALPAGLHAGMPVQVLDRTIDAQQTKPPAHYTDGSLLTVMEKQGLGTPATRARIVEVLLARDYIRREKKALVSTKAGQQLLAYLPDQLRSPELTAEWEARLEAIAAGSESAQDFLTGIRALTQDVVHTARQQVPQALSRSVGLGPCPRCQQGQIVVHPKGWSCSRWKEGCAFTIWKTVAGKTLTTTQVKTLLAGKTTGILKGFRSKTGKSFEARLVLNATGHVTFVFPSRAASPGHHSSRPVQKS